MLPFQKKDALVSFRVYELRNFLFQSLFDYLAEIDIDLLSADVQGAGFIGRTALQRSDPDVQRDIKRRITGNSGNRAGVCAPPLG